MVGGAYGEGNASSYNPDSEDVMDATWGNAWVNADANRGAALDATVDAWREVLDSDGRVFVAEGGQSDFTADVVREIQDQVPGFDARRVVVVQHNTSFNERETNPDDLEFLMDEATYVNIDDGNFANDTADLRQNSDAFVDAALNGDFADAWEEAFDYRSSNSLDFSDTVELLDIVGVGLNEVSDPTEFAERFIS